MHDTITRTGPSAIEALISLVADAEGRGELVVSSNRLVDALLDVRADAADVVAVDVALAACAHRSIVPTAEATDLVASVAQGTAA